MPEERPRYLPDEPLPPYAYAGGPHPHPNRHPEGHSYGKTEMPATVADPADWRSCRSYLRGIDLFNHGYYWEAHEAWESLWQACGRKGSTAVFMQGLIKLAAAGIKCRQGSPRGVRSHARRAAAHFADLKASLGSETTCYMGLCLHDLIAEAQAIHDHAETFEGRLDRAVEIVLPIVLKPV